MAQSPSFLDLANFGSGNVSMGGSVDVAPADGAAVARKKAELQQVSMLKQSVFGSDEQQRVIATGVEQGTSMADQEFATDLNDMGSWDFLQKYGEEAWRNRGRFAEAMGGLRDEKNRERTFGEQAKDITTAIGDGVLSTVAGAVAADGAVRDTMLEQIGVGPVGPWINQRLQDALEWRGGAYSEIAQDQKEQNALEGQLMEADRQATYEAEAAENADGNLWDRMIAPRARQVAGNTVDSLRNMGDQPAVVEGLIGQGLGSMMPSTGAIRLLGAARAAKLGTNAADEMLRVAPMVTAVTESGGAVSQAQIEVMGMTEEELSQSDQYAAMRKEGLSHEDAQVRIARDAGLTAGALALPFAAVGGKITAPFDAMPMGTGRGSAIVGAGRNVVKETVEEGLQEGNSQVASNAAMNSVGVETDLTEGLGESIAAGAVGGAGTAGVLQTPAAVGGGLKAAVDVTLAAGEAVEPIREARRDRLSSTGPTARQEAATKIQEISQSLETVLPAESPVRETISAATVYSPEDSADMASSYPVLSEKASEGPLTRTDVIEATDTVLRDKNAEQTDKVYAAIDMMTAFDDLVRITGDDTRTEADEETFEALRNEVATYESSPLLGRAKAIIENLSPEEAQAFIPIGTEAFAEQDEATQEKLIRAAEAMSRVNPMLFTPVQYEKALEQVGGGKGAELLKKRLSATKDLVIEFQRVDQEKARIKEEAEGTSFKGYDRVRDEIQLTGNSNNKLPSLLEHRRRISEAAVAGRNVLAENRMSDLMGFVTSQVNKVEALRSSLTSGQGRAGAVPFQAWNGTQMFEQKGVWLDPSNKMSVAQAKETYVDARSALTLAETLSETYGIPLPQELSLSPLDLTQAPVEPVQEVVQDEVIDTEPEPQIEEEVAPEIVEEPAEEQVAEVIEETTEEATVEEETEEAAEVEEVAAEPDVEIEEVVDPTPVDAVKSYLDELKPSLVKDGDGRNIALAAFQPNSKGSMLVANENPAAELIERAGRVSDLGGTLGRDLDETETQVIENSLKDALPAFETRFTDNMNAFFTKESENNDRLNAENKNGRNDRPNWIEMFEDGIVREGLGYAKALPSNFVSDRDENGRFTLEPRAMQATFMAAVDWMADALQRGSRPMDKEQVSRMLGRGRNGFVSAEEMAFAQRGIPLQAASEAIARNAQDLLGIQGNDDAPVREVQGLFRSMAASAIEALIQEGDLTTDRLEYKKDGKKQEMISLDLTEDTREGLKPLSRLGQPFSQMFVPGFDKPRYVDQVPSVGKDTQTGNRFAEISDKARKVIRRLENQKNFVNAPMLSLLDTLGDDAFGQMIGYTPLPEKPEESFNKVVLASKIGKNRSIERGINEARIYAQEAAAAGAVDGRGADEVPIHFRWSLSRVGRLQQEGPVTPQGDKIMRELVSATNSTLDLENPDHVEGLWLAVAQSLDISVEKESHTAVIEKVQNQVTDQLAPAVSELENWLETGELSMEAFSEPLVGEELTPKYLHALLTVARMNRAMASGETTGFKTALALEADGKTDGPINAMVHMGTGTFSVDEIERYAKGGLFFTGQETSLNDFIEAENEKKGTKAEDLYHLAAARLEEMFADKLDADGQRMMRVMNALLDKLDVNEFRDDGTVKVTIGRNVVKNPLTVFLYGSGVDGIAGKLTDAMMDTLYQAMNDVAQGVPFAEHPLFAANQNLGNDLGEILGRNMVSKELSDPVGAELGQEGWNALRDAVRDNFAAPMLEAIDEVTGGLQRNMQRMQGASQIQTLVFQELYARALQETNEDVAVKETGEGAEKLSQSDMNMAYADLMSWAPIYASEDQQFQISGPGKATVDREVAASFDGKMKVRATYTRPDDASVKVSPYVTIGTGDGQMMLNIFETQTESLERSLAVFDGVEQPLDGVTDTSRSINEAVLKGWEDTNVYEIMAQGYGQMTARLTEEIYNSLSKETKDGIKRALGWQKDAAEPQFSDLQIVEDTLKELAEDAAARKTALKSMAKQVDHMAGAKAPYGTEGTITPSNDPLAYDEIVAGLNAAYRRERQAIADRTEAKRTEPKAAGYAQAPSPTLTKAIQKTGERVPGHDGVTMIQGRQLLGLLKSEGSVTKDQLALFGKVIKDDPAFDETRYFVGSSGELEAMRSDVFKGGLDNTPIGLGLAYTKSNVVMIANASPETVLHEMLHTRTARILEEHYADPENAPDHVKAAVHHLEALSREIMKLEIDNKALSTLKAELASSKPQDVKIGELISYVLTNQDLTDISKSQKAYLALQRVIKTGLKLIRRLLNLPASSLPDATIFSQVRFNTEVLMSNPVLDGPSNVEKALAQSAGEDTSAARVTRQYLDRMSQTMEAWKSSNPSASAKKLKAAEIADPLAMSEKAALEGIAAGIRMNQSEVEAFQSVHAVISTGLATNPVQMKELNKALFHVQRTLTPQMVADANGISLDRAEQIADHLTGTSGMTVGADGRSDLLARFVAFSQAAPEIKATLSKMDIPKAVERQWNSVDAWVANIGEVIMTALTRFTLSKASRQGSVRTELDRLYAALDAQTKRRRTETALGLINKVSQGVDQINALGSSTLSRGSVAVSDGLTNLSNRVPTKAGKAVVKIAAMATAMGDKDLSATKGEALTTILNSSNKWDTVRSLLNDFRGMTQSNASLLRMINPVRFAVDAMRQDAREGTPKALASMFSRKLAPSEWESMHVAIGQTDLGMLGMVEAQALMADPSSLQNRVAAVEESLVSLAPDLADRYKAKARALATYMMTGEVTSRNLLPNADAIVRLLGESRQPDEASINPDTTVAIEKLVALYAYEGLGQEKQAEVKTLVETEAEGVKGVLGLTMTLRAAEMDKLQKGRSQKEINLARLNGRAGWLPTEPAGNTMVKLEAVSKEGALFKRGWKKVGDYQGDKNELGRVKRAYYISSVAGKAGFKQGIAQSVHETYMGVNGMTGVPMDNVGEKVTERLLTAKIKNAGPGQNDGLTAGDYLLPVFDAQGSIVAHVLPMSREKTEGMQKDRHMGRMLGVWIGRILEEEAAHTFNRQLIDTLKENYDQGVNDGREDEYVNVADSGDKVIQDAWNVLGFRVKADAEDAFGQEAFFPVRRDMVNDAIGYRSASLTDFWTGEHRMNEEFATRAAQVVSAIAGDDAYAWIKKAELTAQSLVSEAKTIIVVKSLVVSVANVLSNTAHLAMWGIPPQKIVSGSRAKLIEIRAYAKNREEIQDLQVKQAAVLDDDKAYGRLGARIQALRDANSRMTISPLIEAGEFSTISEDLDRGDLDFREGKWMQGFTKAVDKLPSAVKTAGKNALITKDTELFKALNRSVQYGDFVAKAVLYDHLMSKGKSEREALDTIMEEFVQYNRLPGRGRDGLETIGLLWFWNYKLRIMKVTMNMIRNRPFSSLMMMGGVGPELGIDSVASGSIAGAWLDGRLGYSVGPEMGFQAPWLNPWVSMTT